MKTLNKEAVNVTILEETSTSYIDEDGQKRLWCGWELIVSYKDGHYDNLMLCVGQEDPEETHLSLDPDCLSRFFGGTWRYTDYNFMEVTR
ncbi:MAG: hypothetical protein LBR20_02185 [Propionibacteriaceae bacterium]|jgi:hypothetical protein|nr:hypothetical protein [Propionibacteriaceae bacterium]